MKKCLVVLTGIVLLALFVPTASASFLTGYTPCGGVGGPSGSTSFSTLSAVSGTASVTGTTATITCPVFSTIPSGDYISQVDLYLKNDAQAPAGLNSSVIDTWTGTSGLTFNQQITTGSSDGVNFNECSATGGMQGSGTCPIILTFATTGSPTSFGALTVTVSAAPGASGGVSSVGGD